MSLLIVGLVLLLVHLFRPVWPGLRHALFGRLFALLFRLADTLGRPPLPVLGAGLALLVAGIGLLQRTLASLPETLPWFSFSLVLLLLTWGSRDLDDDVERYLAARSEEERARAGAVLVYAYDQVDAGSTAVTKGVFYQALTRWFGVLFWFMVFGAAGALLFRLPHALLSDAAARARMSSGEVRFFCRVAALLDLLPAALATLSLAVVGNFDAFVRAWKQHMEARRLAALDWDHAFLPEVGVEAVRIDREREPVFDRREMDGAAADVSMAMSLVWRALVAWLTVIALLILAGLAA